MTSSVKDQVSGVLADAVKTTIQPAVQQLSEQAARQAVEYAKREGPRLMKEQVLPPVMESVGAETPGDLAKVGVAKLGETIKDSGGITGIAGKLMSRLGGGKGGGTATGYGQKRRMPIQQDIFVSVALEDTYKAWTEYKRWTEFMHRANQVDPQIEENDQSDGEVSGSARLTVTEKMWGFKRPFTAEVVSQVPNEHIRWKSTQGTKHVGVIAFHGIAPRLTLISVNIDHAPSGPIEKIARGARFDKRAIRADLHRFKGWVEHKSSEEISEMEGWLGTIEDSQITAAHEPANDQEIEKEQPDSTATEPDEPADEEGLGEGQPADDEGEDTNEVAQPPEEDNVEGSDSGLSDEVQQENAQDGQEGDEEDGEDDQAEDEEIEEPEAEEEEEPEAEEKPEAELEADEEALEDMGKNDLIALARERGLAIRGNRDDLIRRLKEYEEDSEVEDSEDEDSEDEEDRPLPTPRSRAKRPAARASR